MREPFKRIKCKSYGEHESEFAFRAGSRVCRPCEDKANPNQNTVRRMTDAERLARINEHLSAAKEVPHCADPFLRRIIATRRG